MPGDLRAGLELVPSIPGIDASGVLGPVAALFQPKQERFVTALENTAGSRLFQVVVRDDEIASQILQYCRTERGGRLTLLPLEQIGRVITEPQYPKDSRCFPLVQCIEFDESVRPIMISVFGNTLLCEDLQTATEIAHDYNMNCVTLAGEKVGKRGSMRGGYFDSHSSRLRLWRSVQKKRDLVRMNIICNDQINQKKSAQDDIRKKLEMIHKVMMDVIDEL